MQSAIDAQVVDDVVQKLRKVLQPLLMGKLTLPGKIVILHLHFMLDPTLTLVIRCRNTTTISEKNMMHATSEVARTDGEPRSPLPFE